jgi:hypothetical protein
VVADAKKAETNQKIAIANGSNNKNQAAACCPPLQRNQRIAPHISTIINVMKNVQVLTVLSI